MNEMNSLTHSCMHSFASFAILALSGRAVFMMRATGAKLRILASDAAALLFVLLEDACCGEVEDCGDEDDMAAGTPLLRDTATLSGWRLIQVAVIRRSDGSSARLENLSASRYAHL
jgi:hypothetical protein